jgi:hypothetical protein
VLVRRVRLDSLDRVPEVVQLRGLLPEDEGEGKPRCRENSTHAIHETAGYSSVGRDHNPEYRGTFEGICEAIGGRPSTYHAHVMKPLRRLAVILGLALALLGGQQAAAWHDLGHVTGSHKQDSKPGSSHCGLCFACAELSGAVGASVPMLPLVAPRSPRAADPIISGVACPARLAYRSRAPPAPV